MQAQAHCQPFGTLVLLWLATLLRDKARPGVAAKHDDTVNRALIQCWNGKAVLKQHQPRLRERQKPIEERQANSKRNAGALQTPPPPPSGEPGDDQQEKGVSQGFENQRQNL